MGNLTAFHATQDPISGAISPAMGREESGSIAVAYPLARRGREDGAELEVGAEPIYNALRSGDGGSSRANEVLVGQAVRRLTPRECERLQALPDGWTAFGPDSRRYAALGDAVTASVAEWIGTRLMQHVKANALDGPDHRGDDLCRCFHEEGA